MIENDDFKLSITNSVVATFSIGEDVILKDLITIEKRTREEMQRIVEQLGVILFDFENLGIKKDDFSYKRAVEPVVEQLEKTLANCTNQIETKVLQPLHHFHHQPTNHCKLIERESQSILDHLKAQVTSFQTALLEKSVPPQLVETDSTTSQ